MINASSCLTKAKNEKQNEYIFKVAEWSADEVEGIFVDVADVTKNGLEVWVHNKSVNDILPSYGAKPQIWRNDTWYEVYPTETKECAEIGKHYDVIYAGASEVIHIELHELSEYPLGEYRLALYYFASLESRKPNSTWVYFTLD